MRTLIVTAHADPAPAPGEQPRSVTHRTARRIQELLGGAAEEAHLAQEGFDPRFTAADREAYLTGATAAPDVIAEQRRLDRADHVVLVFPVYWWSMPALLKGWVDRVFVAGWAFDIGDDDRVVPRLDRLTAHLVPVSGTPAGSFERHGYARSFRTQVEHGVVGYCGMRSGATAFVHDSESADAAVVAAAVDAAATAVADAVRGGGMLAR
ncbi:NAD(P)H-dependent oxidoreductase [Nocardioides zeae]|uniref:NAD(P)H-dependent oxidoreductase n=1 Tax=Nocardioides imazamoxiresistens TaxID=3231893 RepID=A0ABU3Q0V5_9ACTN|nr:NAD(P)H-dependent oxidoreductase [Nocardioides zeae]MDT9594994.1 NAD(P)H-dependent oxidoreductase [Nocardioides zeae]